MGLRHFLTDCEQENDLLVVSSAVATDLELAAICRKQFAQQGGGKALRFNDVGRAGFSVAANLFGSQERMARLLRATDLAAFGRRLEQRMAVSSGTAAAARLQAICNDRATELVEDQLTERCRLSDIPALRSWPGEIEPYLTLALALTEDPFTGERNIGLYRAQIKAAGKIALNLAAGSGAAQQLANAAKLGQSLPVCLLCGVDPLLIWAATAPLPSGVDELAFCRGLFDVDWPLSQAQTQPLKFPADCELLIEGELLADECVSEGPFANHSGQYVTRDDCPLMQVTAVRHRPDAIVPLTVVGPPPSENIWLAAANEQLIRAMLTIDHPEIVDFYMPRNTFYHGAALLTVSDSQRDKVKQLIDQLWQRGPLRRSRLIIVFDRDIDLASLEQCWWRLLNRIQQLKVYQNNGRSAIDASGIDLQTLIVPVQK